MDDILLWVFLFFLITISQYDSLHCQTDQKGVDLFCQKRFQLTFQGRFHTFTFYIKYAISHKLHHVGSILVTPIAVWPCPTQQLHINLVVLIPFSFLHGMSTVCGLHHVKYNSRWVDGLHKGHGWIFHWYEIYNMQCFKGSFCVCTQAMRCDVTM